MTFLKRLKTLLRDECGNALAIGAASMPILIGGAGLAIDTVQISLAKRELQRAADSAALAGAFAINQNPSSTGTTRATYARTAATYDLTVNNDVPITGTATVQNAPTTGAFSGNTDAVRVQLTANRTLAFFSFFNSAPATLTVEATARIVRDGNFCLLALEDGNVSGVTVGGNATLNLGCGISTNSTSSSAITASGSSSVTASPIMAVGGVPASSNFHGSSLVPFSPVQQDPLRNLPNPTPSNCVNAPSSGPHDSATITTATAGYNASDRSICYNGWDIKGTVNFNFTEPTIVYINGGELSFGAQAEVTANNVTFVLTSTNATSNPASIASLNMNGGANVTINSPTTGTYAGVAIYEDRRAPLGRTIRFNGGSGTVINGALYFPQAYFEYNGGADMAATCIQLIARRLDFRGNGTVTNSCSGGPGRDNFDGTYVRLVA